ncbi:MAG: ornithine cyclodeaminase family protein [Gammaproteobacteria bacterium]|nr:ornithine cyclodeaminase family protein [Gammaproteobacteria bacterium]
MARCLPRGACFELAARAFRETSARRTEQPNRLIVPIRTMRGNVLSVMAGVLHEPVLFGAKISAVYPENRRRGLAGHQGMVLVFDQETGAPAGILHGGEVTARRTAAATAVATRALARADSRVLALIGTGEQASHHLEALVDCLPIERVRIWSQSPAHVRTFVTAHEQIPADLVIADSVETAVSGADVICTVTSAPEPILFGRVLEAGQHVNAVGSSVRLFRELDEEAVRRARLYADYLPMLVAEGGDYLAALRSGAITAEHVIGEVGDVLNGDKPGRLSDQDITLFKSLGIVAEDLTAAQFALEQAAASNAGCLVSF